MQLPGDAWLKSHGSTHPNLCCAHLRLAQRGCHKAPSAVIPENLEEALTRDLDSHQQMLYSRQAMQNCFCQLVGNHSIFNSFVSARLTLQTSTSSSFLLSCTPPPQLQPQLTHPGLFPSIQPQLPATSNFTPAVIRTCTASIPPEQSSSDAPSFQTKVRF